LKLILGTSKLIMTTTLLVPDMFKYDLAASASTSEQLDQPNLEYENSKI
jgi:hypothetical protein